MRVERQGDWHGDGASSSRARRWRSQFEVLESVRPIITTESMAADRVAQPARGTDRRHHGGQGRHAAGTTTPTCRVRRAGSFAELLDTASDEPWSRWTALADMRAGRGTLGKIVTDDALYTEMTALMTAAATRDQVARGGARARSAALMNDRRPTPRSRRRSTTCRR